MAQRCEKTAAIASSEKHRPCSTYESELFRTSLALTPATRAVIDVLTQEAEAIAAGTDDHIELEKKIVISIAIRLLAERHMIKRINNQPLVDAITKNQTVELLKEYKRGARGSAEEIETLEQVNIITPENIHLNSFMYEPILDMGSAHLRSLYLHVKALA